IPSGNFQFPGLDVFPNLTLDDLNVQFGPYSVSPQFSKLNTYQLIDNFTINKGRHNIKFGWEGRKYITGTLFIQRQRGDYDYSSIEGFLLDKSPDVLAERNVGAAPYTGNTIHQSLFVNDSMRVRPNLTFNVGLRYEYKGIPRSDKDQQL